MNNNPFKFGSIVDDPYFTNRKKEIERVKSIIGSQNHITVISPRRFGKSSLVLKVAGQLERPYILIDLQLVTSTADLAAHILKRIYRIFPAAKIRSLIKNFRIIPTITINPVTNQMDVSFVPGSESLPVIEDVLNLMEKLSSEKKKLLVIFDEFQEVRRIDPDLMRQLRSVMQLHKMINYIFLGSQESMIREIFQKKKSPFYHFGLVLQLGKIPENDFLEFIQERMSDVTDHAVDYAHQITGFTACHPYYTQQLAFVVWEKCRNKITEVNPVSEALNELIAMHDIDYERWWLALNRTDKKLMIGLTLSPTTPLSESFYRKYDLGAPSTVFSSLKRLMEKGYINKIESKYDLDDPFFRVWLKRKLE
jgi:hypothetical protein